MRRFFVILLVFAAVFSSYAQESDEWYQGKPIRNILFDGLRNVRTSELEGVISPFIGMPFNDTIYWEILGRLYALEYFEVISPTAMRADPLGNEVIIRFSVTERPIISRINFTGNSALRRNELLQTITLNVHDVATQVRLRLDELAIVNKYLEKGFPDIRVVSEMVQDTNSTIVVNFHIEEGEKITIVGFGFEGNSAFSSRTLQRQLSLRARGLFQDGAFQESKLIADKASLIRYYRDRGYLDAAVIDDIREIVKDDKGNNNMTITFRIYEGRLYTFGGVTFEGNHIFSTEQLLAQVYSNVGEVANDRRIQSDLMRVSELYFEGGYIFNYIEPREIRNTDDGTISYHFTIVERGRAHIENIIVRGNNKTREEVILNEIPLEPGDIFSRAKVMDGLRNLMNLQYFSSVMPEPVPGSADSLMDLIINVEEMQTIDLLFGLAFSGTADPDQFPISAQLKFTDRNFRGSGNEIGAELMLSPDTQMLSLNFMQRRMFNNLPFSGNFDLTVNHATRYSAVDNLYPWFNGDEDYAYPDGFGSYEEYIAASRISSSEHMMPYDQWRISLGVGAGYRWPTEFGNLTLSGGFRIGMVRNEYNADLYRPFDPVLRASNNEWTPATSIWTSLALDQRDIFYDPSTGYYAIQRLGYYGILGFEEEHYIRSDTKAEIFFTLWNMRVTDNWFFKGVLGLHTGVSFIFGHPGRSAPIIQDINMLAVDGMFTGRGWDSEWNNRGMALFENWIELRIPLVPGIIAWDFFFDAAGVKENPGDLFGSFGANDNTRPGQDSFFMRFSLGGGIRFSLPQFPIRFSLAKTFRIVDGDIEWQDGPIGGLKFIFSFALWSY